MEVEQVLMTFFSMSTPSIVDWWQASSRQTATHPYHRLGVYEYQLTRLLGQTPEVVAVASED
jgi:hypothetical protein